MPSSTEQPRLGDSYVALESFTELKATPQPTQNPGDIR